MMDVLSFLFSADKEPNTHVNNPSLRPILDARGASKQLPCSSLNLLEGLGVGPAPKNGS
jgi:hypothetical protein